MGFEGGGVLQVQKKSKAFALLIKYALDPFPFDWRLRKSRLDPSSQDFDRVKPTVLFRCCSYAEKNSELHSFCHENSSTASYFFRIFFEGSLIYL
ncbi:hypothetical protein [Brucella daejeonensis]|uniref:hypothetical protein n=1 Tax=Brucella daejeonensis TaxID=659015 RepID=UPI001609F8CD|nr:hypothetical protein [Brucella daejeonensis]